MAIYYKLYDTSSHALIFIPQGLDEYASRDLWKQNLPYVKGAWISDQITTSISFTQEAMVKPGTGRPYADYDAAFAAIRGLYSSTRTAGWTLQGGDWNGSTWTYNSAYPEVPYDDLQLIVETVRSKMPSGENFTDGDIPVTITMSLGTVF